MNKFQIEILPDGKIKVTSPGGFSPEAHADADRLVDMVKALAGGACETKRLQPHLGNPMAQQQGHGHRHRH